MDLSFHYLIMINQVLFQKKALSHFMQMELTPGQPKILDYLRLHDGCIQKEIAHGCQIEPGTLTGILTRMEEKGLIKRCLMDGNRRASYVYLTDDGKKKSKEISEIFIELEKEVFFGIKKDEIEKFMDIFHKICCNMTDMEGLQ